ncbi:MAG: hypothetical protein ACOYUZ_03070 [Patescibacteria group bacterium]
MKIFRFLLLLAIICPIFALANQAGAYDLNLANRLKGRILLQVQSHGEAWYIRMSDGLRYYMKDGAAAYEMMRYFSKGITDADLAKIPQVSDTTAMNNSTSACASNSLANRLKGEILLQVQQHGEAWYVDPVKCRAIYMADGAAAYQIMRYLGLGIVNSDLEKLRSGVFGSEPVPEQTEPEDQRAVAQSFLDYLSQKKWDSATDMMDDDAGTKSMWKTNFMTIKSLSTTKLEPVYQDEWTATRQVFKATLQVSVTSQGLQYGWENGVNYRWIALQKNGFIWQIHELANNP